MIDRWSIGDEIISPAHGIIVDLQHDAVTIARRNESGRYMEIVFVGEAIRQLRRA